jgi:KaiC/GvpD/RAD55 family RecA-like ATPase
MVNKVKTGIHGLDMMLDGGIPEGKAVLLSGSCGTGKTTISIQYLLKGLNDGESAVYINFEQDKHSLIEDMKSVGFGDLEDYEKKNKLKIIGGNIGSVLIYKEKTAAKIKDLIEEIEEVVKGVGAKRVVLDSVNLFTMLFDKEAEQRIALALLINTLKHHKVTSILTSEIKEHEQERISSSGFEDFVTDGVIKLHKFSYRNSIKRALSVIKMRGVNHSQDIRSLEIKGNGVTIYPDREWSFDIPLNQ